LRITAIKRVILAGCAALAIIPAAAASPTPSLAGVATVAPTLYAYEPQDQGNCLAPCSQLNLWVKPGSGNLDPSSIKLNVLDQSSGAAVQLRGPATIPERIGGFANPIPRFVYGTPGLLVGHVYRAEFAVSDTSGNTLQSTYSFLVNQVTVPSTSVRIPEQQATGYKTVGSETRVSFFRLPVIVPTYRVRITGSRHAGLGFTAQEASLGSAVVSYIEHGSKHQVQLAHVAPLLAQPRQFYQPITALDPSKTNYDIMAMGGTYDAGPTTITLPGEVTSAVISMAPVPTLIVPGLYPGIEPLVPVRGYQTQNVAWYGPCGPWQQLGERVTCLTNVSVSDVVSLAEVAPFLAAGAALLAAGIVETEVFPITPEATATASMIQNEIISASMLGRIPAGKLFASYASLTYYPETCGVSEVGSARGCTPVAPWQPSHLPGPPNSCRPECPPTASLAPPSSLPVFGQADLSADCGASLRCAAGKIPAIGQNDAHSCSATNDPSKGYCQNGLYISWSTNEFYGCCAPSGACFWTDDQGNRNQCLYVQGTIKWADDGFANSGSDSNFNTTDDAAQVDLGAENAIDSTGHPVAMEKTGNPSDLGSWINAQSLGNPYPQNGYPSCNYSYGDKVYDIGDGAHAGADQAPAIDGGNYTAVAKVRFDEEWYDDTYGPRDGCAWQTIGGGVFNTWFLRTPDFTCAVDGNANNPCWDPLAAQYDQAQQDCNWTWGAAGGYPWAASVSISQSCNPRDDFRIWPGGYYH
jgi:hypothetical protein